MVEPVKDANPVYKSVEVKGPMTSLGFAPTHYSKLTTLLKVQRPPFTKQLPLKVDLAIVMKGYTLDPTSYVSTTDGWVPDASLWRHAYNRAYNRLQESINSNSAQLGANLGELRKTAETVNNRLYWVFNESARLEHRMRKKLARWKKRKRWKYRRYVQIAKKNRVSPTVAGMFIEYRWVYESTAKDIHSAVNFMQNFSPTVHVLGRDKATADRRLLKTTDDGPTASRRITTGKQVDRVRLRSDCAITNPNLFWAQQMGLTNPAGIAYELMKFSWLIDWFVTLGEVINSWDDRLGLSFSNSCMVIHREMLTDRQDAYWTKNPYKIYSFRASTVKRVMLEREPSLGPGPFLLVRQIKGPSLVRGATAIALLLQLFRR